MQMSTSLQYGNHTHYTAQNGLLLPLAKQKPEFQYIIAYKGAPYLLRNLPYFKRMFLRLNYTDITKKTPIQSSVMDIMAR